MALTAVSYTPVDFSRIREFVSLYPSVWWIDRLNFTTTVSCGFHATTPEAWAARVGLWYRGDDLAAVALGEGEGGGEAFLLTRPERLGADEVGALFDFVEDRMPEADAERGGRVVHLRLDRTRPWLEDEARRRGFAPGSWSEAHSWLPAGSSLAAGLPPGYSLVEGGRVTAEAKARIHAGAWGYDGVFLRRNTPAFASVVRAPDYRADLDLAVLDAQGRGVSMAGFWYDERNRWGILEPLATHRGAQKLGLGRALIAEGLKRLAALGATGVWVGNDLPFYLAVGFEPRHRVPVWTKRY